MCWCGARATHNARTVGGEMVVEGAQVVVGDVSRPGRRGRLRGAVPAPPPPPDDERRRPMPARSRRTSCRSTQPPADTAARAQYGPPVRPRRSRAIPLGRTPGDRRVKSRPPGPPPSPAGRGRVAGRLAARARRAPPPAPRPRRCRRPAKYVIQCGPRSRGSAVAHAVQGGHRAARRCAASGSRSRPRRPASVLVAEHGLVELARPTAVSRVTSSFHTGVPGVPVERGARGAAAACQTPKTAPARVGRDRQPPRAARVERARRPPCRRRSGSPRPWRPRRRVAR